jgi:hypothetical protein
MAGPLLSTSSSSEASAGNEFITASYFRKSMANGVILYNTTNTLAGTNSQYSATIPAPFVRTYSSLTAGDYIGCTVATNLSSLLGPVVVSTWLAGVPTAQYNYRLLVTAETWWSTNNGATLEGQYGSDPAFINHSAANRHEFMVTVPPTIFTTPATLYVAIRIYQISNADLQVFGGTNTPSQISYNTGAGAYANITILNAGDVYTTNLYATNFYAGNTYTTNLYVTNLYALTHTIENVTISGGIAFVTNSWAGPTNTLTLQPGGLYDLNYASATPCAITGFTTSSGYRTAEALLSVANTAATNITVTLPAGVADGDYTLTHTITNGTTGMFWLRYTPVGPRTNCVFRQM